MPPTAGRKLATILAADVVGYGRLMGADEDGTVAALTAHRQIIDRLISRHGGRIFGTGGDSVLTEFTSAVEAMRASVEIQEELAPLDSDLADDRKMRFRIGVNIGDVVAVWMAEAGVDIERIAKFLGHSDPATTRRHYAHFAPEFLRDAADAIDGSNVLPTD